MQSAKVIDVTRSFVPIDPNAYPENMHGTGQEDKPEERVPVIPYMGWNFLPTSYGQKSFFGTNSALDIDALTSHCDYLFMFQSGAYQNYLIALCDDGIWLKNTSFTGIWTQLVTLTPPEADAFAEWTFCTIKNKLYVFRNNNECYYKIETDLGEPSGLLVTNVVPTFITITSQLGMSRLGGRLCFWDGANAIAYSSPDDLSDFKPAVLTGANVTTFNSILGKISSIRAHGNNAVVYASKSITLLEVQPSETFFVKARPIISTSGAPYLHQSVASVPDTTHFCYTDSGIYKIKDSVPEVIVPEVFDYFKPYTSSPIYLRLLQGRYLCFEVIDENVLNGKAQFSKQVIPPTSLIFAGDSPNTLDDINDLDEDLVDLCDVMARLSKGAYPEQKADFPAPPGGYKPGTLKPIWTCYLSMANGPVEPITWGFSPCGTVKIDGTGKFTPSPSTDAGKLSLWSTDITNKTAKTGNQVFSDGFGWTMERFVAYQTAIWKSQEAALRDYVRQIENRYEPTVIVTTENANSCTAAGPTAAYCTIGRYPTAYSGYQFGFNKCSFWLTRYALAAEDIKNRVTSQETCSDASEVLPVSGYKYTVGGGYSEILYPSISAAATAGGGTFVAGESTPTLAGVGTGQGVSLLGYVAENPTIYISAFFNADANKVVVQDSLGAGPGIPPNVSQHYPTGHYRKVDIQISTNVPYEVEGFTPTPETAWCEITGYEYIGAADNQKHTVTVPGGCSNTVDKYPKAQETTRVPTLTTPPRKNPTSTEDGSVCGIPLDPNDLVDDPIVWPDETVTYPGSTFLLQIGSIAPKYPTFVGAFVYDLHLKKWGKMKLDYKQLLDYSPINSVSNSPIDFSQFGILAGALKASGFIYIFDNDPDDSSLTWGKVGYYRAGMTDIEEVRFDFASLSTGTIEVSLSLDGQSVGTDVTYSENFASVKQYTIYPPYSGKWFNITLTGKFDVSFLEVKGFHKGRR